MKVLAGLDGSFARKEWKQHLWPPEWLSCWYQWLIQIYWLAYSLAYCHSCCTCQHHSCTAMVSQSGRWWHGVHSQWQKKIHQSLKNHSNSILKAMNFHVIGTEFCVCLVCKQLFPSLFQATSPCLWVAAVLWALGRPELASTTWRQHCVSL